MNSTTRAFVDEPIDFLARHPLDVGRYEAGMKVQERIVMAGEAMERERQHDPMISVFGKNFVQSVNNMNSGVVQGENRICFCRINPVTGAEGGLCKADVYLQSEVVPSQESEFVKIWFLPWHPGHVVHATLDDDGPDVFLTSSVNGCSVFVEGTPSRPTVYHANETATKFANDQDAVTDYIDQLYYQNAKSPFSMGSVTRRDYFRETGAELSAVPLQYRTYFEEKHGDEVQVLTEAGMGTVFGRKKNGLWSFYLQERALLTYRKATRRKQLIGKGPVTGYDVQIISRYKALNIRQFWPTGGAHVRTKKWFKIYNQTH
jgi:hypothetical protein